MPACVFSIENDKTPEGCCAFPAGSPFTAKLNVSGALCREIWFYLGSDEKVFFGRAAAFENGENAFNASFTVDPSLLPEGAGLYFCHFEFVSTSGERYYTAFDGGECCLERHFVNEFPVTVFDRKYAEPEWLLGGCVYQIFPDRFARGGRAFHKPDAVYDDDWVNGVPEYPERPGDSFPNNTHFGGTLYGIADKIGYLRSLGITCVYLNPIFDAYSNHKYDTGDFLHVDESFGGDDALRALIKAAHEAGIAIVLDGVFNHVGDNSVYFNKYGKYDSVGAYQSKDSSYYKWFDFTDYPDGYAAWWGIKNLPRTVRCREYRDFITKVVIPKYMDMGVDGWRLDVVDELEPDFLDEIVCAIKSRKPDAVVIGEVWEDAALKTAYGERKRYFRGAQLDSVTNYPLRNAIIDYVLYGDPAFLIETVNTLYSHYPIANQRYLLNFLGSHDTERIATVLGGDGGCDLPNAELAKRRLDPYAREKAKYRLLCAYTLLAAMPGVPCIYYGDEIALEGHHDPFNRRPFPPLGFLDGFSAHFAAVNRLRLSRRDLFSLPAIHARSAGGSAAVIERTDGNKRLFILCNMSGEPATVNLGVPAADLFTNKKFPADVNLPAECILLLTEDKEI